MKKQIETQCNELRIINVLTDSEWNAARTFRQKYFFDKVPILDPYLWTFDHQDHIHFILYKGVDIIGYAHAQLWPEKRAALRIIVIDEKQRNNGYGGEFLNLIEKWLKHQHVKTLHIESSPEAYKFYCKHDYINMPFDDPDHYESCSDDIEIGKIM